MYFTTVKSQDNDYKYNDNYIYVHMIGLFF